MNNRSCTLSGAFANGKAFIPFITCGDPNLETTKACILALQEAGASLIELGIPFSDPTAEGPVIQAANIRALAAHTTTDSVFSLLKSMKNDIHVPLAFMTYANVVFSYGADRFMQSCKDVGVGALVVPDIPYEEKEEFQASCDKHGVALISFIAPTSEKRVARIAKDAQGFIYVVSSLGVTGTRSTLDSHVSSVISLIRQHTSVPCAVGFGISTPEQARDVARYADGVIIGSAIVKIIERYGVDAPAHVKQFACDVVEAIKQA